MDRDRCIYFLKKFHGLDKEQLTKDEVEELLTDYVCDRGYEDKKSHIAELMFRCPDWAFLAGCAFDYYRALFEINILEKTYALSPVRQIISIY